MFFEIMMSHICILYDANMQYIPAHLINSREIKKLIQILWKLDFMAFDDIYSARNEFNVDCFYS